MILQNLHTHTVFGDGRSTAEEMVLGALSGGCGSLGFSEHSPLLPPLDPDGWTMLAENEDAYRAEVLRLREKYAGQLELLLGLEQDVDSPPVSRPYDYIIGSVHNIWADGAYLSADHSREALLAAVDRHFGGDPYGFTSAYFRRMATVVEVTGCQIVGHLDLPAKFNQGGCCFDEEDPRYLSAALEALDAIMAHDVVFEINTGAMSRGYRTAPYPSAPLLRAICRRGGRVCITSDSHSADTIFYAFGQARELARSCGFRETWVLTEGGFAPQGL